MSKCIDFHSIKKYIATISILVVVFVLCQRTAFAQDLSESDLSNLNLVYLSTYVQSCYNDNSITVQNSGDIPLSLDGFVVNVMGVTYSLDGIVIEPNSTYKYDLATTENLFDAYYGQIIVSREQQVILPTYLVQLVYMDAENGEPIVVSEVETVAAATGAPDANVCDIYISSADMTTNEEGEKSLATLSIRHLYPDELDAFNADAGSIEEAFRQAALYTILEIGGTQFQFETVDYHVYTLPGQDDNPTITINIPSSHKIDADEVESVRLLYIHPATGESIELARVSPDHIAETSSVETTQIVQTIDPEGIIEAPTAVTLTQFNLETTDQILIIMTMMLVSLMMATTTKIYQSKKS